MRSVILLSIIGVAAVCASSCNAETSLPLTKNVDSIVVIKSKREMQVYGKHVLLKTYNIALGKEPVGAKRVQGDMKTPEGIYTIDGKNPASKYYKNLGVSYPNAVDKANAKRLGRATGGDIKIHGLPNGQGAIGAAHRLKDWTHGCIAVTNEEIDELYRFVTIGAAINILP